MHRALAVPILVLALLTPSAAAERALAGEIAAPGSGAWSGAIDAVAPLGLLNVTSAALAGDLRLSWEEARGHHVVRNKHYAADRPIGIGDVPTTNESIHRGAGHLENVTCPDRCRMLVYAFGTDATLALGGRWSGAIGALDEAVMQRAGGPPDEFRVDLPAGWLALGPAEAPLAARAQGTFGVLLFGVHADAVTANGRERWETGYVVTPEVGAAGIGATERRVSEFLVLELRGARLETGEHADATLLAPRLDVALEGAWTTEDARGWIRVDRERREVDGARVAIEGALRTTLRSDGAPLGLLANGAWIELGGAAERVRIDGAEIAPPRLVEAAPEAALTIGALVLLALLALALWPAYSRIRADKLLENPKRARLHAELARAPWRSVVDLARAARLAPTSASYHLHRLAGAGLVRLERRGRVTVAALAHDAQRVEASVTVTLADPTRRRVAEAIARAPEGVTQAQVSEATGIPRRLVSHHLARLRESGLVEAREGWPPRHAPSDALVAELAPAAKR